MNRTKISALLIAVTAILLTSGCAVASLDFNDAQEEDDIMVQKVPGCGEFTIDGKTGEEIVVAIPGNVTTGYVWKLISYDGLEFIGESYEVEEGKENLCGAGGANYFKFKCDTPGSYTVVLDHLRPWIGSEGNISKITVNVQ